MNKIGPAEQDGSAPGRTETPSPPDVGSDRLAPGQGKAPVRNPLPIAEIEDEEDDAKGG
jgi:hypothetical protein